MTDVRYPQVTVPLSGQDGNAMMIIGRVRAALRRARVTSDQINAFTDEAMSGDYDKVLQTAMRWVNVT